MGVARCGAGFTKSPWVSSSSCKNHSHPSGAPGFPERLLRSSQEPRVVGASLQRGRWGFTTSPSWSAASRQDSWWSLTVSAASIATLLRHRLKSLTSSPSLPLVLRVLPSLRPWMVQLSLLIAFVEELLHSTSLPAIPNVPVTSWLRFLDARASLLWPRGSAPFLPFQL